MLVHECVYELLILYKLASMKLPLDSDYTPEFSEDCQVKCQQTMQAIAYTTDTNLSF